ncbi:UDP-glycosyltransferase 73B5-like [Lolium rigidum]|uniref:UDP-glycosyltransferase 73B5-like n=1 Tax=Lolium rigidum TaxID=89674 RepID=UPI001F5CE75A|nr:UDP-glycosyltransferase 73B5-like [Lolium rigidum]
MANTRDEPQLQPLHILFLPYFAPGHLIPVTDIAGLFAARGAMCTILTTPVNTDIIRPAVDRANAANLRGVGSQPIVISVLPFPDVGLPPGMENLKSVTPSHGAEYHVKFVQATQLLREPFDQFLATTRPRVDAVVSDSFFAWSTDSAAAHGVPRLVFLGSSVFAWSCSETMLRNSPLEAANCPDEPDALVLLPGLPHRVELRRSQMLDPGTRPLEWAFASGSNTADQKSFGEDMAKRSNACSPDVVDDCLRWLNTKPVGSVVYISFGTLTSFSLAEHREIARGLDLSGKNFVWVLSGSEDDRSEWMPDGFTELTGNNDRGFLIRGWAPQTLILSQPALGGFVTHGGLPSRPVPSPKSKDISVILGMDWLMENGVVINCGDKTVSLLNSIGGHIVFQGDKYTLLEIGLELNSLKEVKIEEIPVVNEFQDVFPKELPSMPPDSEIEFTIDLIPGTSLPK